MESKSFNCRLNRHIAVTILIEAAPGAISGVLYPVNLKKKNLVMIQGPMKKMLALMIEVNNWLFSIKSQKIVYLEIKGNFFLLYFVLKNLLLRNFEIVSVSSSKANKTDKLNFLYDKYQNFVENFLDDHSSKSFPKFTLAAKYQNIDKKNLAEEKYYKADMLSVIIPTRDVELSQVRSLINQITPQLNLDDEIIVVDDNEKSIFLQYQDESLDARVKIVPARQMGIGDTRNIGLKNAMGELCLFVDSDDEISEFFIEWQRSIHYKYKNIAATGFWLKAFGAHQRIYHQFDVIDPLVMVNCMPPAGVLMWKSKHLNELNGFDPFFKDGLEDFDLITRANISGMSIVVIDEIGYFYQRGQVSLSQKWSVNDYEALFNRVRLNQKLLSDESFIELQKLMDRYDIHSPVDRIFRKCFDESPQPLNLLSNSKILNLIYKCLSPTMHNFLLPIYLFFRPFIQKRLIHRPHV
jgi:glycosyltransferase involved in cell wall biosynthesis